MILRPLGIKELRRVQGRDRICPDRFEHDQTISYLLRTSIATPIHQNYNCCVFGLLRLIIQNFPISNNVFVTWISLDSCCGIVYITEDHHCRSSTARKNQSSASRALPHVTYIVVLAWGIIHSRSMGSTGR